MCFDWIQSVTADQLPDAPFRVNHYTTVVDSGKWLAKIQEEAKDGMEHPRARRGALQREIERIQDLIEGKNSW